MTNLASVLAHESEYAEAERMHRQILVLCETVLGKEHPDMLMSVNNLANVPGHQGISEEATRFGLSSVLPTSSTAALL